MPLAAAAAAATLGLMFHPADPLDAMWDTWIFRATPTSPWLLNYLVKHHSGRWNAVGAARSADGAHFADLGVGVRRDCWNSSDCAVWLGSGSVWRRLNASVDDEYVMNYSQEYDCGGGNCQSIFFATSTDLQTWTPVAPDAQRTNSSRVFRYNATGGYSSGRWDCIAVLPRPAGGYFGYWTASPDPHSSRWPGIARGGAGFGWSADGLEWHTLPTPGPQLRAEVGGVLQAGGRTFMTFDAGHLYEAPGPEGPFTAVARNFAFHTQEGGSAFARLWGELYTANASLNLVTHQQVVPGSVYAGLVNRAALGADGVLREVWWGANDALRAAPAALRPAAGAWRNTSVAGDGLLSGLWLEGTLVRGAQPSGVLFQVAGRNDFGVWLDGDGTFLIGAAPGHATRIDRAMDGVLRPGPVPFRALLRNTHPRGGILEFYIADVLTLPWTAPDAFTGQFAATNGAVVAGAFELSLGKT